MKPLAPNTTLQDRYKITEMIGKGGMGEVYLAIDQRLGHSVALKRTTVGDDPALAEAFEREARTLAQLRHSVLPKVSDHFIENEEQILIMDYISGEDLSERLKATNKAFPLNWVMFWADQLLDALTYLHTHNPPIIHRDIKPQNLKLTRENHVVLLDFGLSKNALERTQVTTSGSVVGYTPHYASMEQIRGTGTNARSDLFSLSATLYQLISNEVPADALSRADAMLSGMPDPITPLTAINPQITDTISETIIKGMEITQEKRFETARDMQKALRRAYNNMQKSMTADTIAFNSNEVRTDNVEEKSVIDSTAAVPDLPLKSDKIPESSVESQVLVEPVIHQEDLDPTLIGGYRPDDLSAEKTEVIESSEIKKLINSGEVDSTNQIQREITGLPTDGLAAMETEEIPSADLPDEESIGNLETAGEIPAINPTVNDLQTNENFQNVEIDEESNGEFATSEEIPSQIYETTENTADSIGLNEVEADGAESVGTGSTGGFAETDVQEISVEESDRDSRELNAEATNSSYVVDTELAQIPSTEEEKVRSTGKYIAILGGLGAVLFLLLGTALAVGWYYTNGGFGFGDNNSGASKPESEVQTETVPNAVPNTEVVDTENNPSNVSENETDSAENTNENSENLQTEQAKDDQDSTDNDASKSTVTKSDKSSTRQTTKPTTTTRKPPVKTTKKPPTKTTQPPPVTKPPVKKPKKDAGVL